MSIYTCPCVLAEKPVDPCGENCFHFSPDNNVACVHCGNTGVVKHQGGRGRASDTETQGQKHSTQAWPDEQVET